MSDSEQRLPAVTLPSFATVVTGLCRESSESREVGGGSISFRAEGHSMYPSIRDGESIVISPLTDDRIVRGDVLLCRHGDRLLAHRVVELSGAGGDCVVRLRGDAKRDADAPVPISSVIGKVVSVRRDGRTISLTGRWARLRYRARTTASRAKMLAMLVCVARPPAPQTRER